MSFNSKYKGAEAEALLDKIAAMTGGTTKEIELDDSEMDAVIETMQPNCVYYKRSAINSMTIRGFAQDGNNVTATYTVLFMVEESTSLALPDNVEWLNDEVPDISTFADSSPCELSIRRVPRGSDIGYTAVLGRFSNF